VLVSVGVVDTFAQLEPDQQVAQVDVIALLNFLYTTLLRALDGTTFKLKIQVRTSHTSMSELIKIQSP
jgi:hypothetical protein